ncbi:MAG TPA: type III-A CRISPR-associated RAMP protein Csm4 [Syntrophomonadaceae bacterium]|nr:type III-A CRISPR-associated RAMP protein Csm4 [Syntrophomonadaceae bacterium]
MGYYLYKLKFTTPLHIGKSSGGNSLDDGQMTIHADTIFAALCAEAVKIGKIEELYTLFNENVLTITDALPYKENEIYLPKPILYTDKKKTVENSPNKKTLKNLDYIAINKFKDYLQFINQNDVNVDLDDYTTNFGNISVNTRVAVNNEGSPLPYHVAAFRFNPACGLYIILQTSQTAALDLFNILLESLGLSGIGGKQSSGWGKFEVYPSLIPEELKELLDDKEAPYQMLLGTYLPKDEELDSALANAWYMLLRRGGFVRSETYAPGQLKKRTIYMLGAGSCLRRRIPGAIFDLSDNGNHPVWRSGKTLFVGVNI